MPRFQFVAVDTNILLRLADGEDATVDAWEVIKTRVRDAHFLVPPRVVAEILEQGRNATEAAVRASALRALREMRTKWELEPARLNSTQSGIALRAAERLHLAGLLPATERNDAVILAQAAVLNCILLVSHDSHLRGIERDRLKSLFDDLHLNTPLIATPREVVRMFYR